MADEKDEEYISDLPENIEDEAVANRKEFEKNLSNMWGYSKTGIEAKKAGNKTLAGTLKLVINTTYGCMKSKYSSLYDPKMANQVCITGQLLFVDLIEKLEPYITLIQLITWLN